MKLISIENLVNKIDNQVVFRLEPFTQLTERFADYEMELSAKEMANNKMIQEEFQQLQRIYDELYPVFYMITKNYDKSVAMINFMNHMSRRMAIKISE